MIRALPALLAAAVLGLAAPPALADATASVRALMADLTGRPVRQIRASAPAVTRALPATAGERLVRRTIVAVSVQAPRVSPRPPARPLTLMQRHNACSADRLAFAGIEALVGPRAAVCARPLEGFAPRALVARPSAAPGQVVIVTDGRVRVQTLR